MTKLSALFPPADLARAVLDGYVRVQTHPTLPWSIFNYTDKASWENYWTPVTLQCRGLVIDDKGNIIARPFPKFFNYGQPGAADIGLEDEIVAFDKADGSLGILLPNGEVCTRGSFTSEQAVWATTWWKETRGSRMIHPDITQLFEIVYPGNRIVIDYGDIEGLIALGSIHIETGDFSPPLQRSVSEYRVVAQFPHRTLQHALSAPPRANAEGLVIWKPSTNERVKIKYDEYVRLHKFLTGVNERHIWEVLAANGDTAVAFSGAPDEFHAWIKQVSDRLLAEFDAMHDKVTVEYLTIVRELPFVHERKVFVEQVIDRQDKAFLFALYDGKQVDAMIWRMLKPKGGATFRKVDSDAD